MADVGKNHGFIWYQYLVLGSQKYTSQIRCQPANPAHQFWRDSPGINAERYFLDDPLVFVYITNVAIISVLLSPHSHALRPRFHWWQNQIDFPFKACGRLKIRPPSKILSQFPRNCKWQHIVIGGGAPPLVKE
jgi:hypothetical protein